MAQYESRIHIKVLSPSIWSKFKDTDDASYDLANLADSNETSYVSDGCYYEDELASTVEALSVTLGEDGIIIADTTNINVDPYNYCCYYLGDKVKTDYFDIDYKKSKSEMFFNTSIYDIIEWLDYGEFSLSEKEKKHLLKFGIASIGKKFKSFSNDINLPDKIYIRETSFDGRIDTIEKSLLNEEVYFTLAKNSYDPTRLEVKSELGSLGYLPSDISDVIAPLLFSKKLYYKAYICELIPQSKRNKHVRSAIVAIHIDATVSPEDIEIKKSVKKDIRRLII